MFRTQNLCPGSKIVFDLRQNIFCFRAGKVLSATHVSRTKFPSLASIDQVSLQVLDALDIAVILPAVYPLPYIMQM